MANKQTVLLSLLFIYSIHISNSTTITRTLDLESSDPQDSQLGSRSFPPFPSFDRDRPTQVQDNIQRDTVDCPSCQRRKEMEAQQLSPEELKRLRIEMIKKHILKKLHMTAPPNFTRPLEPLPSMIQLDEEEYRDTRDAEDRMSEMFVFPDGVSGNCYSPLGKPIICLDFHFNTRMRHIRFETAELWVYKYEDPSDRRRLNQTLVVSEITNPNDSTRKAEEVLKRISTDKREGWVKIEMKGPVYQWLRSRNRHRGLEIVCETCETGLQTPIGVNGEHKPFFKISMERRRKPRVKRSENCEGGPASCCLERLWVDFNLIGWDWIHAPRGYYANYCKGSCRELIGAHLWQVSRVLGDYRIHVPNTDIHQDLAACCVPTATGPLDLLHYQEDGTLVKKTLNDMRIESCDCL